MCLIKTHKWPKIAWKPIKVYKVLDISAEGELMTPCRCELVKFNKPIKAAKCWIFRINTDIIGAEGVHAYIDKDYADAFLLYNDWCIYEGIIPRFSLYWTGKHKDIAATKMIVKLPIN